MTHRKANTPPNRENDSRELLWITDRNALERFCRELADEGLAAVDTEFHRERTYYAKLALVQLAGRKEIACVDPLVEMDLSPLDELMMDRKILKIFHAGRQDLEIFVERNSGVPGPFFDTQVAAALLGLGEQIGYGPLVQKIVGITLGKSQVRTDWMHRPLATDVVHYAADDVRYLHQLYEYLDGQLRHRNRRDWLDEEQTLLADPGTYRVEPEESWERVKGTDKLKGVGCAIAQHVAAWREKTAQELDRPRRRILPDEIILDLARQRPHSIQPLERMRGLDPGIRKKYGTQLIRLVQEAEQWPKDRWPQSRRNGTPREGDDAIVSALSVVLQLQARDADISPALLATRSELSDLAAGQKDLAVLQGWRKELAGQAMLHFLDGQSRLRVKGKRLVLEDTPQLLKEG